MYESECESVSAYLLRLLFPVSVCVCMPDAVVPYVELRDNDGEI